MFPVFPTLASTAIKNKYAFCKLNRIIFFPFVRNWFIVYCSWSMFIDDDIYFTLCSNKQCNRFLSSSQTQTDQNHILQNLSWMSLFTLNVLLDNCPPQSNKIKTQCGQNEQNLLVELLADSFHELRKGEGDKFSSSFLHYT